MSKSNFPSTISLLATYFMVVFLWLVTHATRLGIATTKIDELTDLYGDETTVGTYVYCKHQYDITPGRKPTTVTQNLAAVSVEMKKLLTEIYNDIPASKWTNDDRTTLNRKTGLPHDPTRHTVAIAELCILDIINKPLALTMGGARSQADNKNHSIPDSANAIEIRYAIVKGKFEIPESMKDKVRETCIGPNDDTVSVIYTKSLFELQLDESFSGYNIQLWGRWIDVKHKELSGQWSEEHNLMIG